MILYNYKKSFFSKYTFPKPVPNEIMHFIYMLTKNITNKKIILFYFNQWKSFILNHNVQLNPDKI